MAIRSTIPLAALSLSALAACSGADGESRPHVILITLDTVRADFLSCYGATTGDTPALDRVARDGAVFDRAVAASGLTPTSHATILTGKFQYGHGLRVLAAPSGYRLDEDQTGLATAFKEAGYRTGAIHSAFPVSGYFGFDNDFDEFQSFDAAMELDEDGNKVRWDIERYQRRSDETTARALEWFTQAAAEGDAPVFLWLHYWDPHDPVILPPEDELEELLYDSGSGRLLGDLSRMYAAELRYQDRNLGSLFRGLSEAGLMDDTLLAVTADHGQGLEDGLAIHGWSKHRVLYREVVHVPLILRGPGVLPGTRVRDQVRTADIAPTLIELAGLEQGLLDSDVDGVSLVERLDGQPRGHLRAYGEQINGYDDNAGMRRNRAEAAFLHMVSDGEWKLIYRPHMPERSELFHISTDPNETRNVRAAHPAEYLRLMADLAERNPWVLEPFPEVSKQVAGAPDLSSLGYSGAEQGEANWYWTCPEHGEYTASERGRHDAACGRILVPVGQWREAR
ncbi:MAG: sulfatase [Planctomycetota bacterium]|nr:sulfatase [Planctomycetota bacterium]MEC8511211.1 sulfatase [Planctomycetota bacterium]